MREPRSAATRAEWAGIGVLVAAIAGWTLLPFIAQDQAYHRFADQRAWLGIPRAADVLSNAAFAVVGMFGVARLVAGNRPRLSAATTASLWCISAGLILTSAGSACYHLDPNDRTLTWDRLPMTVVFAGILGAAVAERIGDTMARALLPALVLLGIASVFHWRASGDLSLYVALQFGGVASLLLLILATRGSRDPVPWGAVIAWYAVAKIAEAGDAAIWEKTGGVFAGHAIKHLAAACAGAAALRPLWRHDRRQSMRARRAPG